MNAADIVAVVAAAVAVAGLGWFFFGPRKARTAELAGGVQRATVSVRGGYSPEVLRVRQGVPVELVFDRQESGDCTCSSLSPTTASAFPLRPESSTRRPASGCLR